jgi:hypothetical protein
MILYVGGRKLGIIFTLALHIWLTQLLDFRILLVF